MFINPCYELWYKFLMIDICIFFLSTLHFKFCYLGLYVEIRGDALSLVRKGFVSVPEFPCLSSRCQQ